MYLFKKIKDLQQHLAFLRRNGKTISFVPTMGALHKGHLSLIELANKACDVVVCSIFVNPTQFNDPADLKKYPRTISNDIKVLTQFGNDVLFFPEVEEVYPPGLDTDLGIQFGQLDKVMEGKFRPGHFNGMAQVVWRLLDIIQPDCLFMGQKDFQQFTIVQNMLSQKKSAIQLVLCPIIREEDGLALSSRNVRLESAIRQKASLIHQTLLLAKNLIDSKTPAAIQQTALKQLEVPGFRPEYFEIVDGYSLESIQDFESSEYIVACAAVWAGEIRLIDNIILKKPNPRANQEY